jgi:hypothetical protein
MIHTSGSTGEENVFATQPLFPYDGTGSDVSFEVSAMSHIAIPRRRWLLLSGVAVAILAGLGWLLAMANDYRQEVVERASCSLTGIAMAFHNYQEANGALPPAVVYDKDGKPLYSWRVLLLPYIEERELYQEFRLNEPWDSEHNIALLPRMPKYYAPPGRKAALIPSHHTVLHVFVGWGTPFEKRRERTGAGDSTTGTIDGPRQQRGLKIPDDFPDGTHNTFLFVEAGKPVPWTKPEQLPYDADQPLPELGCLFREGFSACAVDASRFFIRKDTSEATMRAFITRNGGEEAELYRLP